ncbi:MAG: hypothetical protein LBJ22_03820 [Synergistaceae bacterium]|nr:hypothetical protein [Synergistaceae bacterium]
MTTTAEREELLQIVRDLPDEDLATVLYFTKDILDEDKDDEPNDETAKILRESEAGLNMVGPFHNMNDFMVSLLAGDDA